MVVMSDLTQNILVQMGWPHAMATGLTTLATVKPGMVVTNTDEATADSSLVRPFDAGDEVPYGIAGRNPEHDIDTVYPIGSVFPIYLLGGGHVVWCFLADSQAIVKGVQLEAVATGDVKISIEANKIENVGVAYGFAADAAQDEFIQVLLT